MTQASAGSGSAGPTPARTERKAASRGEQALSRFHEESRLGDAYDSRMLLRLWPFVRPHARYLVLSLSLLVINALLALSRPLIMRAPLNGLGTEDAEQQLIRAGLLLTGVMIFEQSLQFPQLYTMQLAGGHSMADLRAHVFRFLHTRRLAFFDRTPVGRLVSRVTSDIDAISEMFASGALNALGDLIKLACIVVVLIRLDWQTSLFAFAAVPPVALGVNWTRRRIRDAFREIRSKTARMNAYLNEQVSGMAIVQAYAREERAAEEFNEINSAYRSANNRSIIFDATLDAAIEMVSSVCIAAVLWWVGGKTFSSRMDFGTLFTFVYLIEMFFQPIRDLSARYTVLQSAMAGAERIFELLENKDEDAASDEQAKDVDPATAAQGAGVAFALDNVTFSYKPEAPVLREVTLAANVGEKVALVGATGAGKSTVASLLLRLYDVTAGAVKVFDKDVRSYSRDALRRSFAVVPQDVFLFPGTVATNIAAGDAKPDRDNVVRALERIGALDLFQRREGGLDAPVLERGHNFSAGERQLIAFARALYRDPPILILDEATANVDSDTEARLQRALEGAMKGRTAMIIAHRLSTIRAVDRIVVFHKGCVVEQGTHEDLLAAGGIYSRLHRLQFARQAAVAATG
jgi:ATP-binding cassette subfamily B protein